MAAPGLLAIPEMIGMIATAAKLATADLKETVEAKREAERAGAATSYSLSRATGTGTGSTTAGMGAAQADGVTTNGLAAALQITRGRLR